MIAASSTARPWGAARGLACERETDGGHVGEDAGMASMTIEELAEQTQTSPRTIRYYIAEGMLPSPGARGRSASYGEEHLVRLRLVRALLDRHLPLAEIKRILGGLSLADARALLSEEDERQAALSSAAQEPSPKAYISELLRQTRSASEPGVPYGTPPGPIPYGTPPALVPYGTPPSTLGPRPMPPYQRRGPGSQRTTPLEQREEAEAEAQGAEGRAGVESVETSHAMMPLAGQEPSRPHPQRDPRESTWRRIELTPDLELLVREEQEPRLRSLIDHIRTVVRQFAWHK